MGPILVSFISLAIAYMVWYLFLKGQTNIWSFQHTSTIPAAQEVPLTKQDVATGATLCPACNHFGYILKGVCEGCGLNLGIDPEEA